MIDIMKNNLQKKSAHTKVELIKKERVITLHVCSW